MESEEILTEIKKAKKNWHHDIKRIDGLWVEDFVSFYQKEKKLVAKEEKLKKILDNYAIYRIIWANAFAKWTDNDVEGGKLMHDEIVWRSADKFRCEKCKKSKGRAFNAYLVSSLMNWMKNLRNGKMSHKNHPRVVCPICGEQVYQIDQKHLRHRMAIDRYQKLYPELPLVSFTGEEYLRPEYVTIEKFWIEHSDKRPHFPVKCPVTGIWMNEIPDSYTTNLFKDYSEDNFLADFPDFKGTIECPYTGKKKLHITQVYLDSVLQQEDKKTIRQVPVLNPYTAQMVTELTPQMLRDFGITVHEHIYNYKTIELNKKYSDLVRCPYTGRKTYCMSDTDLKKLGKSAWEFYMATCSYPLRKFQVRCVCGEWVDNIWEHLEHKEHAYAEVYDLDHFTNDFSSITTRAFVSTNSFFESDSGDSTHISDLISFCFDSTNGLEVEDSLTRVAEDKVDLQIAKVVRNCQTIEDIYHASSQKLEVPVSICGTDEKICRSSLRNFVGNNDFDVVKEQKDGKQKVVVSLPSKDTIRKRLQRMLEASDLYDDFKEQQKCQTTKTSS